MTIQLLSPRLLLAVLALNWTLAVLSLSPGSHSAEVPTACTIFPRDMWQPLRTIVNKLEDDGWVVLRRTADTDDCYHIDARDPEGRERLLVIDPVSGKLRRERGQ